MKLIKFIIIFFLISLLRLTAQPMMVSTNFYRFDFNQDSLTDASYIADVISGGSSWLVGTGVVPGRQTEILRKSKEDLYFSESASISPLSPKNTNSAGYNDARLVIYTAFQNEFQEWIYLDQSPEDNPRQRLSLFMGLRFREESDWHYAWLKFVRPDSQIQTLFTLDSYDWNPIPNAPIGAGLAPEVPIQSEWLPDGSALRLSWPAALASWVLESTPNLNPPLVWEPFPSGGTYADVVPEDPGRFFRLRKP